MSLLEDLRFRLLKCLLALVAAFSACLVVSDRIYLFVSVPIMKLLPKGASLIFVGLPDSFLVLIKLSVWGGFLLVFPYVIYQIIQFAEKFLVQSDYGLGVRFVIPASVLFYLGATFCYFLVIPAAFSFFLSFETSGLKPMLSVTEYTSLFMTLMVAFGLVFETPVAIVMLGMLGLVNSNQLRKARRYSVVFAFVAAAILTPTPDPLNQTLMAGPMIVLYEVGLRFLSHLETTAESRNRVSAPG